MKKLFIALLLCALMLTGCAAQEPEILFDEAAEGIVSVILEDYNDGTIHYDTIGPDGHRQPAQPFESDPLEILTAAEGCFENHVENQPPNRLVNVSLLDESGNPAEITGTHRRIFELASQQEHVITKMCILQTEEHHFVTIEWNVNFWDPHVVYYYDPAADTLTELCTYDATQAIGLKILNLPRS
ncbi:MAG: hypothetical protein IJO98_10485 [Clostridia bacterium]|nr:hypothetical protein [Clostridia bacterium]